MKNFMFGIDKLEKDIKRFRDTNYGATKDGLIYNFKTGRFLKGHVQNNGYIWVKIGGKNGTYFPAHRIVAECYIPIPEELKDDPTLQIDHINCIRTDNRVDNLRWVNAKMNRVNPLTYQKLLKPVSAYHKDGTLYKEYPSMAAASKDGFCRNAIYKAIHKTGRAKYHKGFEWRFVQ